MPVQKLILVLFLSLLPFQAAAQVSYLEEMRALGSVSGQGLACNASKYDKYEMLARAIMLTKAPSPKMLQDGVYAYNAAKADSYLAKQRDGGYLCGEISGLFDHQDIFRITLYEDGTLKMPDGKIITPKTPYDAKQIYKSDNKLKEGLKEVYAGSVQKAQGKMQAAQVRAPASTAAANRPLQIQAEPAQRNAVRQAPVESYSEPSIGHISRRTSRR